MRISDWSSDVCSSDLNRNGTLKVDAAMLTEMLESDPQGVEALFNPGQNSSSSLVSISNEMGRVKPGTYTLTSIVAAAGGIDASGFVDGIAMTSGGSTLIAPVGSAAVEIGRASWRERGWPYV